MLEELLCTFTSSAYCPVRPGPRVLAPLHRIVVAVIAISASSSRHAHTVFSSSNNTVNFYR